MQALIISLLTLMFAFPVSAQRTVQINERIQASFVNSSNLDLSQLMTVHPEFEISNIAINGMSLAGIGSIEFISNNKSLGRMVFTPAPSQAQLYFPQGIKVGDIKLKVSGGVYVETLRSSIIEK